MGKFAPILSQIDLIQTQAGASTYAYPSTAIELIDVIFDNKKLYPMTVTELRSVNAHVWRDHKGPPIGYIEDTSDGTIRVVPAPQENGDSFVGKPLDATYPHNNLAVFHVEKRSTSLRWTELYLALLILAREFERESNHQDQALAKFTKQLSDLILSLII